MKIKVVCCDGRIEVLTLVPPVTVDARDQHQNVFHCGDGTSHFFTLDGVYDGWGRKLENPIPVGDDGAGWKQAMRDAIAIDLQREIEDGGSQTGERRSGKDRRQNKAYTVTDYEGTRKWYFPGGPVCPDRRTADRRKGDNHTSAPEKE